MLHYAARYKKAPNYKTQIPNKFQITNSNFQN